MKSGLCRSRQDKLAWKCSWPWAHTVQAKEGKVEGEAEILKKEITFSVASGYRGGQWHRQGPGSFLNAALLP